MPTRGSSSREKRILNENDGIIGIEILNASKWREHLLPPDDTLNG